MDQHDRTTWTDEAVSRLPLHQGRAELLEEIMSTTTPLADRDLRPVTTPRQRRWLVPVAAAAAVTALASATLWWPGGGAVEVPVASPPTAVAAGPSTYAVLDAAGWRPHSLDAAGGGFWVEGDDSVEITVYPASVYDGKVEDRSRLGGAPAAPGDPVVVDGAAGQVWAYGPRDHTMIREVVDGSWIEVRGQGMGIGAFGRLLEQVEMLDAEEFDTWLPARFLTRAERRTEADRLVAGIAGVSGAGMPEGRPAPVSGSPDPDLYDDSVLVGYACAWITTYVDAVAVQDQATTVESQRVLGTADRWPGVVGRTGMVRSSVAGYAELAAAGRTAELAGFESSLGCPE